MSSYVNDGSEIERFKRNIDLTKYAKSKGFKVDSSKSWNGTTALRDTYGLIFVKKNDNGQYVYWSPTDPKDAGSIVDFVQNRMNLNLGGVRKELRQWI